MDWVVRELVKYIRPTDTVLDVCCGNGRITESLKCQHLTALDIVPQYIAAYKKKHPKNTYIVGDARNILELVKTKHDVVVCTDGLEHLEKEDALTLLQDLKLLAIRTVFILTPDRLTINNPIKSWGIDGGDEYQKHRCYLSPSEIKSEGFERGYTMNEYNPCDPKRRHNNIIYVHHV